MNDWQQMVDILSSNVEDLAAALHSLLRAMSIEIKDEPQTTNAVAAQAQASTSASSSTSVNWQKLTLQLRNSGRRQSKQSTSATW